MTVVLQERGSLYLHSSRLRGLAPVQPGAPTRVPALNPFGKGLSLLPQFPHLPGHPLPAATVERPAQAAARAFGDSDACDVAPPRAAARSGAAVGRGQAAAFAGAGMAPVLRQCRQREEAARFRRCRSSPAVMVPGLPARGWLPVKTICGSWTSSSSRGQRRGRAGPPRRRHRRGVGRAAVPRAGRRTDGRRCRTSHFRNSFAISQIPGPGGGSPG